ncbi:hypothetical protein ACVOMV_20635 [Mesorhizobium atlanticum]
MSASTTAWRAATAALVMRPLPRRPLPGILAMVVGSRSYRGHEGREMGFRARC